MNTTGAAFGWVSFSKPKDDWYYLPREDRERLLQSWAAIRADAISRGAAHLGDFEVRASSSWARMAMWEFADLTILTEMIDALSEASYYQYFAEENTFGRKTDDPLATYMTAADHTTRLVERGA